MQFFLRKVFRVWLFWLLLLRESAWTAVATVNCRRLAWREFLASQARQQVDSPATFNQHHTSDCAISFRLAYLVIEPATEMKGDCVPKGGSVPLLSAEQLSGFYFGLPALLQLLSDVSRWPRGPPRLYLVYCERFAPCPFWGSGSAYWFTWF